MRGFGNLLILDHGESYLTVYANAEALLKQVGQAVAPASKLRPSGRAEATKNRGYTLKYGTWAGPSIRYDGLAGNNGKTLIRGNPDSR